MNRRDFFLTAPALSAFCGAPAGAAAAESSGGARLKPAICAYSYRNALKNKTMTYQDLVRLTARLGADGIDMTVYWFPDTSDEFLRPLRRLAYKMAVTIYSIGIDSEMTRPTPELRQAEVEAIKKWVDVAEKLGAGHIRVFGGSTPKGITEEEAAGWVVEALKRASEYSAKKGVILGLENHGGITGRAESIVKIVKTVDSPWVGINLDAGNFRKQSYEQIGMCLPYAVNVHLKTDIAGEDGKKTASDWDRILKMLAGAGYNGYVALEYEAKESAETAVPALIARLKQLTRKYSTA
jgi:sugar phosphate isomerase/epimerase